MHTVIKIVFVIEKYINTSVTYIKIIMFNELLK